MTLRFVWALHIARIHIGVFGATCYLSSAGEVGNIGAGGELLITIRITTGK